jgi:hypothetical protein
MQELTKFSVWNTCLLLLSFDVFGMLAVLKLQPIENIFGVPKSPDLKSLETFILLVQHPLILMVT